MVMGLLNHLRNFGLHFKSNGKSLDNGRERLEQLQLNSLISSFDLILVKTLSLVLGSFP